MKNQPTKTIACALALILGGCVTTVQKDWQTFSGNKTDGIVTLGYQYSAFKRPVSEDAQGHLVAIKTCKSWGYETATAFDLIESKCIRTVGVDCYVYNNLKNYQCE